MRIGAHMSVAGGVSLAVDRAVAHGCEALQIFTRNASRWQAPPLDAGEVRRFRRRIDHSGITPVVSHASYLINLATAAPALRAQSIDTFADEMSRAEALGLLGVVLHPGTCTSGTGDEGLQRIADGLREVLRRRHRDRALILLEHTAGQGRVLGWRFDHLAAIVAALDGSPRIGLCLDTCHLLASGYDIAAPEGYEATFAEFARVVGLGRLKVFHANDSKRPCGSRVDRHEHIGAGHVGLEPFRRLLHDPRFRDLALIIETEKSKGRDRAPVEAVDPLDQKNLDTLRRLRSHTSHIGV
ncbi:MAG: deoxyribonuclease IV [Acidimicrobiia bacterium]|nr:deoxyribonuclease IV [Acidimicrobiia bacterium]